MTTAMPLVFFGHGNPMNALSRNAYSEAWAAVGASVPRPSAILAVSAHWYVPKCAVTAMAEPRTIHDFGGFPDALYRVRYPAPGSPALARRVRDLLAPLPVDLDESWGIDHGTWSVLVHAFPGADVPLVQLAIDARQPPAYHREIGARLAPLRDEGVFVIGSGNVVHNLRAYRWGDPAGAPYDWAERFDGRVRQLLLSGDDDGLVAYEALGEDAALSVPTPDHYLPLLYLLGLRRPGEPVAFPAEGIEGGALSMLAVRIG
jgi:4,5-DOPA dioxygenase extradiol